MSGAEERFILANRLALVVVNSATSRDPTLRVYEWQLTAGLLQQLTWCYVTGRQPHVGGPFKRLPCFGLNTLLNLAAKSIGVRKTDLQWRLRPAFSMEVFFARERRGKRRLAGTTKPIEVVNNARRSFANQFRRASFRIGDKRPHLLEREIGVERIAIEIFQQVSLTILSSHDSCDNEPKRVK